jgi:hypothetical protein
MFSLSVRRNTVLKESPFDNKDAVGLPHPAVHSLLLLHSSTQSLSSFVKMLFKDMRKTTKKQQGQLFPPQGEEERERGG